jgi:glycosyltransferase involved in cell wall biosynthesis
MSGGGKVMRLVIITGVIHYRHRGQLWAYGPYVREIEMWADLFSEVRLAAACRDETPPSDCLPIQRANVSVSVKSEVGGAGLLQKAPYLWNLPVMVWQLIQDLMWADAVHVRSPANLALLGMLLAPIFSSRMVCKYAGQWVAYPGEPVTVRLQRALLASFWWRGPVTVYGRWPNQPSHVVPFFSSAMSEQQLTRAKKASAQKRFEHPLRVLYVGRLSKPKNVSALLRAVAQANASGAQLTCAIVGEGKELSHLQQLASELGIEREIEFAGGLDHERVLERFQHAHILVLASESEGWPKSLVEGMAHGLICVGSNRGLIPELLGDSRGIVVPPGDAQAIASVLSGIAADPQRYGGMSRVAAVWAQGFSLERLRDELRLLLESRWRCALARRSDEPAVHAQQSIVAVRSK